MVALGGPPEKAKLLGDAIEGGLCELKESKKKRCKRIKAETMPLTDE